MNGLTTLKLTSASSSARRISRMALLTSSSVSVPRARTSDSVGLELLGEGVEHVREEGYGHPSGSGDLPAVQAAAAYTLRIRVSPSRTVSITLIVRSSAATWSLNARSAVVDSVSSAEGSSATRPLHSMLSTAISP